MQEIQCSRVWDSVVSVALYWFCPYRSVLLVMPSHSLQVVETVEQTKVCGEKLFSETTKTLLQRYQQTTYHAICSTAVMSNNHYRVMLTKRAMRVGMLCFAVYSVFSHCCWSQEWDVEVFNSSLLDMNMMQPQWASAFKHRFGRGDVCYFELVQETLQSVASETRLVWVDMFCMC